MSPALLNAASPAASAAAPVAAVVGAWAAPSARWVGVSRSTLSRIAAALVVAALVSAGSAAQAQTTSALLNEALDRQCELKLDTTVQVALKQIADQTGVRLVATAEVWEVLPWGEMTHVEGELKNLTLRKALTELTMRLGLMFSLKENYIEIAPHPALMRMGRRSTTQEIEAMGVLATVPLSPGDVQTTVQQMAAAVDKQLESARASFAIENRVTDNARLQQPFQVARNATLLDALESLSRSTTVTWYPWGQSIVIVPREDQIRLQLQRTVTKRFNLVDISQVLLELSRDAGVEFLIEPGAIQSVPAEFRTVKLYVDATSIQSTLEVLAGATGLGYVVNDKGVYFWHKASVPAAAPRDRAVGIIKVDGMDVIVTESMVPSDLRERIKAKVAEELDRLDQTLPPAPPPAEN